MGGMCWDISLAHLRRGRAVRPSPHVQPQKQQLLCTAEQEWLLRGSGTGGGPGQDCLGHSHWKPRVWPRTGRLGLRHASDDEQGAEPPGPSAVWGFEGIRGCCCAKCSWLVETLRGHGVGLAQEVSWWSPDRGSGFQRGLLLILSPDLSLCPPGAPSGAAASRAVLPCW